MAVPKPDYLSRDFVGLKGSLLQFASASFPEWQPASEGDFGMVMLDLFAYMGDILSYYTDRTQFENYLGTATQRDNVLGLAYLLGYLPNSGTPAAGTVNLVTDKGMKAVTVPAGTQISTGRVAALDGPVVFETANTVTLAAAGASNPAVVVIEGSSESYVKIGESTGQPSQVLVLPHTGVYRDTVHLFVEDSQGTTTFTAGVTPIKAREWLMVDHLLDTAPDDTAFEVQFRGDSALVNLGDDINGAIPSTGLQIFASYRHGVGSLGNVSAGQVRLINDRKVAGVHVQRDAQDNYLSSAMGGGTDAESVESIRFNAPRAYRTQGRIVSVDDFKDAALGVEGVSKANVLAGTFTSVTVYVAGADGGIPSPTLQKSVKDRLSQRTLAGVDVTVAPPTLVPVNFGSSASPIKVELYPQYSQSTALAAIERAIRLFVTNMAFGERLAVGKIYDAINRVEGVQYVDIPVMARDDAAQSGTGGINPREWEVFKTNNIYLVITGGLA